MRLPFLALSLVAACGGAALDPGGGSPAAPADAASDRCPTSVGELCHGDACFVDGLSFPRRISGWCDTPMSPSFSEQGCGGYSIVSELLGDQGIAFYYDASGTIYAVTRWVSDPPCHGACRLVCAAGPADASASQLPACNTGPQPMTRCH